MRVKSEFVDILTDRLVLRRLEPADAGTMFAYRSDPQVSRYQNWEPGSASEILSFIGSLSQIGPDTPGRWFQVGIALRESGELIGDCGIQVLDSDPRQVQVGITLAPSFHRRGLATEALAALFEYLFVELGKHRVVSSVDPRNVASMALMHGLGMRQEAHFVESLWFKGAWADDVVFALLDREWHGRRES